MSNMEGFKLKIAFDAQLLFEKQKTGIGWTAENILKNIIEADNNEYVLNYFSLHHRREKNKIISDYKSLGYKSEQCFWLHNVVYRKIWNRIPIPYSMLFQNDMQITQFFNYDVPPGIKGKAVTFIYDMVYKVFPETISKETLAMLDNNLKRACEKADHIITISEFSKSEIMKYMKVAEDKISVMPCGVNHSLFHPDYTKNEVDDVKKQYGISGDYLLYLGTLEPRKNLERLVAAYAKLKADCSDIPKLVLAGKKGWLYDKIFTMVELNHLEKDVVFTDYVREQDVPLLLNGASVFIFPSIYEGFGLPPLEAMACGTPVITSNTASLPEVVGDAAVLVNPYDINDIKNSMKLLIFDLDLRDKLKNKGLKRASLYSWKKSTEKLKNIYKKIY